MTALLQAHRWIAEARADQAAKNLLWAGQLSAADAASIVQATSGRQATSSPHHANSQVTVWEFRPIYQQCRWYVKFYFTRATNGDLCVVISFHR